ncbi:hypothetical protein M8C21_015333 [Ambrosia artemisiifolia]|uniref:Uncharacterized protein n=1 Tax=Ambrosia artemisiifolia TaxID=4212 RepID=A0AAD5D0R7_AMBAR|nr:hypothetical protein M8C21_015333 [Ambrosia artemisiifolia]
MVFRVTQPIYRHSNNHREQQKGHICASDLVGRAFNGSTSVQFLHCRPFLPLSYLAVHKWSPNVAPMFTPHVTPMPVFDDMDANE